MSKEAMKQALEALEWALIGCGPFDRERNRSSWDKFQKAKTAIKALEEALANHIPDATKMVSGVKDFLTTQQEQDEPVGEILLTNGDYKEVSWKKGKLPTVGTKLYTTPQQRKPLEEPLVGALLYLFREWKEDHLSQSNYIDCVEGIKAAHGIKE